MAPRLALLSACLGLCVLTGGLCVCGAWAGVTMAVVALVFGAVWTWFWSTEESVSPAGRAVLITGCDTGFGHALALSLSGHGLHVFAGVLDSEGAGAQRLREQGPERVTVLQMDVTNPEHIAQVKEHVKATVGERGLWGLVNNAGILLCPVDVELTHDSSLRRLMEVNFLSAVAVTQAFLPLIRKAKGRVVNVSSMAGTVPMPRFSAYSSSKAALSSFSRVLRLEMLQWGVHVSIIQPTGFRTKIFSDDSDFPCYVQELLSQTPAEVVQDYGQDYISHLTSSLSSMFDSAASDLSPVLKAIEHALLSTCPRVMYYPGSMAWIIPRLHSHLPTALFDRFIIRLLNDTRQPSALEKQDNNQPTPANLCPHPIHGSI